MSKRLQEQLNAFIRGQATDGKTLCDIFFKEATDHKNIPDSWNILVPREVYEKYWDLHEASLRLVEALEKVLDDPEHQLIMEEAEKLGYCLPALDVFHQELDDYRNALLEFDPYKARRTHNDYIQIPIKTAELLHNLMRYNCFMVARVMEGCFNTEYMKHFGFYKRSGYPYQGATALQETLNVLVEMCRAADEIDKQIEKGRQHKNWPDFMPRRSP